MSLNKYQKLPAPIAGVRKQRANNRIDLNIEQKRQVRQVFDLYDIDKTGKIDLKDLKKALRVICPEVYIYQSDYNQEKDLIKIFKKLQLSDVEVSGINQYQFAQIVKLKIVIDRQDYNQSDLVKFFELVDVERTGYVTVESLRKACENSCGAGIRMESDIITNALDPASEPTASAGTGRPTSSGPSTSRPASGPSTTSVTALSMTVPSVKQKASVLGQRPKTSDGTSSFNLNRDGFLLNRDGPTGGYEEGQITSMIEESAKQTSGRVSLTEFLNMMKRAHRL